MAKKQNESLTDKYLNKKFGFKGEFEDFERYWKRMQMQARKIDADKDVVVYTDKDGDWRLIKNPSSIDTLGSKARGVIITKTGDIYMEEYSKYIHNDLLTFLHEIGVLEGQFKRNWNGKLPTESGFLTVQRYKDTDIIAIGESNKLIYKEDDWHRLIHIYDKVIGLCKSKNPNLNLTNKLVGTKNPWITEYTDKSHLLVENVKNLHLVGNYLLSL